MPIEVLLYYIFEITTRDSAVGPNTNFKQIEVFVVTTNTYEGALCR